MEVFSRVTKMSHTNAHGEVNFFKIEEGDLPQDGWEPLATEDFSKTGDIIVGHSESGSIHVLERPGVTVSKYVDDNGFQILRAIVDDPTNVKQEAGNPHDTQTVLPGTYIITNAKEKPFFQEQARRVAD